MKVLCNKITKKIEGFNRWDDFVIDIDHVQLTIDYIPDNDKERLNDTNDGLRPITQAEIDAEKAIEAAQIVDSPALKSAIEEFSSILQAASIPVPADIMNRITNRVKAKL